jgi:ankyrin repeat protein
MYEAICGGDCEAIDRLIANGIDINTRTEGDEWNFLHRALVSLTSPPNAKVIQHFVTLGVDVNARDRNGWTPLHFAVRANSAEVVKLLVNAGAHLDVANDRGVTPLHLSLITFPSDLETVKVLLRAGADPDADFGGGTARRYANIASRPDTSAILSLLDKYKKG